MSGSFLEVGGGVCFLSVCRFTLKLSWLFFFPSAFRFMFFFSFVLVLKDLDCEDIDERT